MNSVSLEKLKSSIPEDAIVVVSSTVLAFGAVVKSSGAGPTKLELVVLKPSLEVEPTESEVFVDCKSNPVVVVGL